MKYVLKPEVINEVFNIVKAKKIISRNAYLKKTIYENKPKYLLRWLKWLSLEEAKTYLTKAELDEKELDKGKDSVSKSYKERLEKVVINLNNLNI